MPFATPYQRWYSEVKVLIKQLLPDRLVDFVQHYEKPKSRTSESLPITGLIDHLSACGVTPSRRETLTLSDTCMADETRAFLAEHDAVLKRSPRHSTTVPEPSRGSIPACAGKPNRSINAHSSSRVYPRVCGEASVANVSRGPAMGLSPRVRGSREGLGGDAAS